MRVAVVGPGALGCFLAGALARPSSGIDVVLVDRDPARAERIGRSGLSIQDPEDDGGDAPRPVHPALVTADPTRAGPCDLALVTVKARDTASAAETVAALLAEDGVCASLQNGLGNVERLAERLGATRVVAGVTTHGATLLEEGRIRHTGSGETVLASFDRSGEPARRAAKAFDAAGLPVTIGEDWRELLWGKVAVNAAINALTALLRVKNGALLESEAAREIATEAAREAAATARATGSPGRGAADPADEAHGHDGESRLGEGGPPTGRTDRDDPEGEAVERAAAERAIQVMAATAGNRSSALQDALAGRPLEVDAINGEIARAAARAGIRAPVNDLLARLCRAHDELATERIGAEHRADEQG